MFLGIPYATVNRTNVFGESIPQEPFDVVFEAYDDNDRCPQVEEFNSTAVGTLDCLKLNIFVPDTASSQSLLPVMVYVYGGALKIGFADRFALGPKYLVRHDVILVTFNYRLGPYGFMCLDTPEIPGNAGLKDQVAALRWVKSNIQSFGGNPNQVTAFGNSAGGRSIGMHLNSETEKLFTNAIIQSGSVFRNMIKRFYLGDAKVNNSVRQHMTDFMDDTTYTYSTVRSIKPYLRAGADKIYQYVFSYDGGRNFNKYLSNVTAAGVSHADELGYLFDIGVFEDEPSEEDQVIIDRMTTMWTNFAKYNISSDLVVETSIGSIRGVKAEDGNYTMFLGIPFAKVNESNIFGESIPQAPFDEIFEANTETTRCPQVEEFNSTAVGDLDCLQLNVYLPDIANTSQSLLPVMVYIYGGGFVIGFSDRFLLGPKYLIKTRQDKTKFIDN
ncbi:carboxylesterase family domain-containing protein [Phthorimaea operculella]|nr:carboxylesterase family domain-containing protein [Phthorimaea operculella]